MNWLVLAIALQDSVTEEAAKALRATAQGGFAFAGEAKTSITMSWAAAVTFSGAVGKTFEAVVRSKFGKSTYGLFHKGGKTAERLTWRNSREFMTFGGSADDVLSLLDLEPLAKSIKSGEADPEEDGGRVIRLTLGKEAIRSYREADFENAWKVDSVSLKLWIGKDGLVRKKDGGRDRALHWLSLDIDHVYADPLEARRCGGRIPRRDPQEARRVVPVGDTPSPRGLHAEWAKGAGGVRTRGIWE